MKTRLFSLGFIEKELVEIENLASENSGPKVKNKAFWELALWHAEAKDEHSVKKSLEYLQKINLKKKAKLAYDKAVVEIDCLLKLKQNTQAVEMLEKCIKGEENVNLLFSASNITEDITCKVDHVNKALHLFGLDALSVKKDEDENIFTLLHGVKKDSTPQASKVSILVPTRGGEEEICSTLESILQQSWSNFEVVLLSDNNNQQLTDIVTNYNDHRIKIYQTEAEKTFFELLNIGLDMADGEFVTIVTDNEWVHPERIKKQTEHLINHNSVMANTSQMVWTNKQFHFYRWKHAGYYLHTNLLSLMFRRENVLKEIGFFDEVLHGAEYEYIKRIQHLFGEKAYVPLSTGPVSFKLERNSFFCEYNVTFSNKYRIGVQKEYLESFTYFHEHADSLFLNKENPNRVIPVPFSLLNGNDVVSQRKHFDVIIASDFRLVGGSTISNIEEIKAQKLMGIKTGLIQMARYDVDPSKTVNPKVREEIDGDTVRMLVFEEKVSCDVLIIRYPPILHEWQKYVPNVKANHIRIIINQPPMSDYGPNAVLRYDLKQSQEHIVRYFEKKGIWYPIGPLVREALYDYHKEDLSAITLSDEDWANVIHLQEWKRPEQLSLRESKTKIGRHSRDHEVKWPVKKSELLAIYPDSKKYEVYILGGAINPTRVIGYKPNNWHVYEFGEIHPKEFLSKLDVFVYYTHPDWVESFGRVIIEAMAVGVPVILPHSYQKLFGEAAIYAEPFEVLKKIDALMEDETLYKQQSGKALRYVEMNFGYTRHAIRLNECLTNKIQFTQSTVEDE
ncbi:glycosyltransferase family A protein [Alkalihalobacterium bogoriense]|uniref:glycosyltransferase family A protein n=1 Tax=Alkalihalobacterium bogoriense TaxID=246272 RepID=UPI00146F9D62|nr:glycosyltransferase family A protein [Alkalihalobacterium bogoriense]